MLKLNLDISLETITIKDSLKSAVTDLVKTAEAEGWLDELFTAAKRENPRNTQLRIFTEIKQSREQTNK